MLFLREELLFLALHHHTKRIIYICSMIIKEIINIQDDRVSNALKPLVCIMNLINNSEDNEVIFDCSDIQFVSPLFIVSLMLYLKSCGKNVEIVNISQYLDTVRFKKPLKPDEISNQTFLSLMGCQEYKSYIPVISFPASSNRAKDKDAILTTIESILCSKLNIASNVSYGLKYIIGEMVDNISEHSESERGYIFAQYYKTKKYFDLCIADEGIKLYGSFNKAGIEVEDDIEAMKAANKCMSSKNLPDAENRGYGIFTSKKMLITGLGGQYMMMSGSALYLKDNTTDQFLNMPNNLKFDGTIIALRFPTQKEGFDYSKYFE